MLKQTRVNQRPLITQRLATLEIQSDQMITNLKNIFERLCKLETVAVDAEEDTDRIDTRVDVLGDTLKSQIKTLESALTLYVGTEIKQLNARMGSDFQDQDDEIEKIQFRLSAVEDKLKVKQLAEQTNVELTARVKELQRQLAEAKHEIDRWTINGTKEPTVKTVEVLKLSDGRIVDQAYIEELRDYAKTQEQRADSVQRELNQTSEELDQLKFSVAAERSKPSFWRIFGP